jgi:hypothetical protein
MKGHPTRVTVQPPRYSSFDPDRWRKTRGGVRTEIVELQKLVFEVVLHPNVILTRNRIDREPAGARLEVREPVNESDVLSSRQR